MTKNTIEAIQQDKELNYVTWLIFKLLYVNILYCNATVLFCSILVYVDGLYVYVCLGCDIPYVLHYLKMFCFL